MNSDTTRKTVLPWDEKAKIHFEYINRELDELRDRQLATMELLKKMIESESDRP